MAWYNPSGKCAYILRKANQGKINIFSPDSVKKEIFTVLKREADLNEEEIHDFLFDFDIHWIKKDFYKKFIHKVSVNHEPDKPVEAAAIGLNCGILSADKHFKDKINIDKLIGWLKKQ